MILWYCHTAEADIHNLYSSESIQADINAVASLSDKMQMKFNIDKCHTLHLGHNNPKHQYTIPTQTNTKSTTTSTSYNLNFHNLTQVSEEKDLGVTVDEKLNFYKHIEGKINKANQMLGIIRRTFKYIDTTIFNLLYKSLVRPHVEYASVIWSPHTKKYQNA